MQIVRGLFQEESKRSALFQHLSRVKITVIAVAVRQIVI